MAMELGRKTYSASRVVGASLGDERTTLELARAAEVFAGDLDVVVELLAGGRAVLEEREPLAVVLTDTHVEGSPVTNGLAAVTPLATLAGGNTLGVDVVLGRGGLAFPAEVLVAVRAGQGLQVVVAKRQRNGLGLGTRVVSTADSNLLANIVLDVDTTNTLHAQLLGHAGVGQVKLAVLALETSNGLTSLTLGAGPLGLLVTSRARVGAHGTSVALVTSDGSDDAANQLVHDGDVLDTRPATETKVFERDGTVLGGEGVTVELAIGEVSVDARGTRGRAAAAGATAGACSRGGRARGLRRRLRRRRGRSLSKSGRGGSGRGSRGGSRGRRRSRALASLRGSLAAGPLEAAIGNTLADIVGADHLAVQFVLDDGASAGSALRVVTVSVVVRLSGNQASSRQGEGNSVELHFVRVSGRSGCVD